MSSGKQPILRKEKTEEWKEYFEEYYKRKPTKEEGLAFGTGFNSGWKSKMHQSSKEFKKIARNLIKLINNGKADLVIEVLNKNIKSKNAGIEE